MPVRRMCSRKNRERAINSICTPRLVRAFMSDRALVTPGRSSKARSRCSSIPRSTSSRTTGAIAAALATRYLSVSRVRSPIERAGPEYSLTAMNSLGIGRSVAAGSSTLWPRTAFAATAGPSAGCRATPLETA